jgi:hypothetical protein
MFENGGAIFQTKTLVVHYFGEAQPDLECTRHPRPPGRFAQIFSAKNGDLLEK